MSFVSSSDGDNDENYLNRNRNENLNSEKILIYTHPLFPLLTYLLEQCEQATVNPSCLITKNHYQTSFEHNFQKFLTKQHDLLTITRNSNDLSLTIDKFYIDAMQVLRIHLLELEKLDDLCEDFCQRYIACLKVKLNPNNIFTDDEEDGDDDDDDDDDDSELNIDKDLESTEEDNERFLLNQQPCYSQQNFNIQNHNIAMSALNLSYPKQFNDQNSFSQILSSSSSSFLFDTMATKQQKYSTVLSSSKRGVLPKSAISVMRSWLFQHIAHPYPSDDEKRAISKQTNLSLLQVNNWFINARRRILQPMLELSNPDLLTAKKKKRYDSIVYDNQHNKSSQQSSYTNRYWPSNLTQ